MPFSIRPAEPRDIPALLALMRALAEYERLSDIFENNEERLLRSMFGERPAATAHLAEQDGKIVGYAICFQTYSTFLGIPGLWLEDLFVLPECRGQGIGKGLLSYLADSAQGQGFRRMEWAVLDWNQPAIEFYHGLGAKVRDDWRLCRLDL